MLSLNIKYHVSCDTFIGALYQDEEMHFYS